LHNVKIKITFVNVTWCVNISLLYVDDLHYFFEASYIFFLIHRYTDAASSLLRLGLAADKCNATNSQTKVWNIIIVYLTFKSNPLTKDSEREIGFSVVM
jgi:hypothetical protein